MLLMKGKELADEIKEALRREVQTLGFQPSLTVILVGDDPASKIYVNSKEKASDKVGFRSEIIRLPANTPQSDLIACIRELNSDPKVHGILVQLPLPKDINTYQVIEAIDPGKDVDCFHPYNFGRLFAGNQLIEPCTPKGVMRMIDHYGIQLKGKNVLVIGRSNIVGKPIALLLMQRHATVTIAHSHTQDLAELARRMDIIVSAVGKPEFIKSDWIKQGAVVIDIGINRVEDSSHEKGYRVTGDVDFNAVKDKCSAITPVPGGVGPMTIAMLLENTLILAKQAHGIDR